jgi:hypothetical protein
MLQQGSGFRLGFQGSGLQNPRVHITPIEGNAPLEGIDSTIKFALPGVYPALWNGEAVNLLTRQWKEQLVLTGSCQGNLG